MPRKWVVRPSPWITGRAIGVCAALNIAFEDFVGKGRQLDVIHARRITAYLCRFYKGPGGNTASWQEIAVSLGRGMGGHASLIDQAKKVQADPQLLAQAEHMAASMGLVRNRNQPPTPPPQPIAAIEPDTRVGAVA